MSTITGTVVGVVHLGRNFSGVNPAWNFALVSVSFPAYIASTDSISITGVGAAIETSAKRGKTNTLKCAMCAMPGQNSAGTAFYPSAGTVNALGALTISTDALLGGLKTVDLNTEVSVPLGSTVPAQILVAYTEA